MNLNQMIRKGIGFRYLIPKSLKKERKPKKIVRNSTWK